MLTFKANDQIFSQKHVWHNSCCGARTPIKICRNRKETKIEANLFTRFIQGRKIFSLYQPIVSIQRGAVLGVEALARGKDVITGEIIPPDTMFHQAAKCGMTLELDRVCREKALEGFASMDEHNRHLLSINLDTSCINQDVSGSRFLLKQVKNAGIGNNHVVLELLESRASSTEALMKFISAYRRKNFLIALDDVGSGFSNLERIPLIKPDILKLDRSLVSDVHKHFHKQELVRSFVQLGYRTGSQVVAEGVESPEEVVCLLELGIGLFQGFYFARPSASPLKDQGIVEKIKKVSNMYRRKTTSRLHTEQKEFHKYRGIMDHACSMLINIMDSEIEQSLAQCLDTEPKLECLYVLNPEGIQISATICNPNRLTKSRQILYEPAARGSDHSLKEYYLPIGAGQTEHTTDRYISQASGNPCVTIARFINNKTDRGKLILCADIGCGY